MGQQPFKGLKTKDGSDGGRMMISRDDTSLSAKKSEKLELNHGGGTIVMNDRRGTNVMR